MRRGNLARGALAVLLLASPVSANAQSVEAVRTAPRIDIAAHVREASQRFGIPEHWIFAVIRIESAGRTRAVSSAGAMGLMQLMPGTWARQRARFSLGSDPFDPRDNIMAGTSYLREMHDRYGAPGFLAAYNAGPGRYEDWLGGRRSLPLETHRYVARIAPLLQRERLFVAADGQAGGEATRVPYTLADASQRMVQATEPVGPATPFALYPRPAHDLFAPVSTASDP